MAYTQADLDKLDADIAKLGIVEQTSFGDQSTRFRPIEELRKLREIMATQVEEAQGTPRTRYASVSKGV